MSRAPFKIEAFAPDMVPAASALVAARVARLRNEIPLIPEHWQQPTAFTDRLAGLVAENPSVMALAGSELVGFLSAMRFEWSQGRWAYSPEWANYAAGADARAIRHEMYASLAATWVADDRRAHFISLLPNDDVAREAMSWVGFGVTNVDGLRDVEPVTVASRPRDVVISRAGAEDFDRVETLEKWLREHLASAPLFLCYPDADRDQLAAVLADPETATLLATDDHGPLAFLRIGPHSTDASTLVRDPGTASITRAFTREDRRGKGVAGALLDAAAKWARDNRYVRCSVDFESANLLASAFWPRHFSVVGLAMGRRL